MKRDDNLEALLRKGSVHQAVTPPTALSGDVMRAVRHERGASAPEAKPSFSASWRMAPVFGACALALTLTILLRPPSPSVPKSRSPEPVALNLPAMPKLNLDMEDPLSREWRDLVSDSRNAARSLAANFLPSNVEQ
jgi:hypothetical protein